jgi:hypothetical protein
MVEWLFSAGVCMAGIGFGPVDFAIFEIDGPEVRAAEIEARLQPKLLVVAGQLAAGLSRVAGRGLQAQGLRPARRRGAGPEEALVAFADTPRELRGIPFLALGITREQLHARVAVRGSSERSPIMRRAVERESANLARRGKPFRRLRHYTGWNGGDLPEIAPAGSAAFWLEVAEEISPPAGPRAAGVDLGVAWSREEARSLAVGDVLGAFRDLAPLYKLLVNAQ